MTSAARRLSDESCSNCNRPVPEGAGHYRIDFDIRRIGGDTVEIEHARTMLILCAKCSLQFDLTRLDIPTHDGWYSHEPLCEDQGGIDACAVCRQRFADGERFEAAQLAAVGLPSEEDGPLVTVSLCEGCAPKRALSHAFPPGNEWPPYCYQCGKYTGYTGGMPDERRWYLAHPHAWRGSPLSETVRVCNGCFCELHSQ